MTPDDTHRRGSRFVAGIPAECRSEGRVFTCSAHNLSRTGVLLEGALSPSSGAALDLTLKSPTGTFWVAVRGRVIRDEADPESGTFRLAVEFSELSPEQKESLEVLIARVIEGQAPGPLEALRPDASVPEIRKALEAVPLPHRIALASRANLREREILRVDLNPAVLESLARNPNLILAEARALAQSPHLIPSTLEILAHDTRWTRDEDLRNWIVAHPKVPLAVGESIIAAMNPPVLRKLLQRPGLPAVLREKIVKKLARG